MAIERDATSIGSNVGTTLTVSHTITGDDRILFVSAKHISGVLPRATGVTYNGVAMTEIAELGGTDRHISLWYLIAPDTGTHNIVATHADSVDQFLDASSYTGVKQSDQPDASNTYNSGDSLVATIPITVTVVANDSWAVIAGISQFNLATLTAGTNATTLVGTMFDNETFGDISAGSFQMIINVTSNKRVKGIMASFAPTVAAAPTIASRVMIF